MIKLVAFDLDGTIGNTIPMCIRAFRQAVGPYAKQELSDEMIVRTFGLNEEGMVRQVVGTHCEQALDAFYTLYESMHVECAQPFDGIRNLIEELQSAGIHVTLITGKGERSCAITLRQFGMEKCFERISTGLSDRNVKAEQIGELFDVYGLHPDEILYVGDALSDVMACRKVGVQCLSAAWAASEPDIIQLEEQNGGNVLYSVEELCKFLTNSVLNAK